MADEHLIKMLDDRHEAELARHAAVMERLGEVLTEQRLTNATVVNHTARIAVLEERNPGKQGGMWGALGGLIAGFAAGLIK